MFRRAACLLHRRAKMENSNNSGNGRRPDWAGHTFVLALVFGIGGALMTAIGLALGDTRHSVKGLHERELVNAFERGQYTQRVDSLIAAFAKFDVDIQREMRDLDNATLSLLNELDSRLQAEIARSASVGAEDRKMIRDALETIRQYQDGARAQNAAQDERLKAVERTRP